MPRLVEIGAETLHREYSRPKLIVRRLPAANFVGGVIYHLADVRRAVMILSAIVLTSILMYSYPEVARVAIGDGGEGLDK